VIDLAQLVALETEVWDALVRGDAATDERLLAVDFVGLYPTGYADRADHVGQLAGGPTVASYSLTEARMLTVSGSAALLMYQAEYTRVGRDRTPEVMYVSSLWVDRGGRWVNVFSQDTPATGIAVV